MIYQILIDGRQIAAGPAPSRALADFIAKGWTLRQAAKRLGVQFTHLHRVLAGDRHSASLLRRVQALPVNPHRTPTKP